jgi:hypothetical protein
MARVRLGRSNVRRDRTAGSIERPCYVRQVSLGAKRDGLRHHKAERFTVLKFRDIGKLIGSLNRKFRRLGAAGGCDPDRRSHDNINLEVGFFYKLQPHPSHGPIIYNVE